MSYTYSYIIAPSRARSRYVDAPWLVRKSDYVDVDTCFTAALPLESTNPDFSATSKYCIATNRIILPDQIVIKPLVYRLWKLYSMDNHRPETIRNILENTIISIRPANFNLYDLCIKRGLFWDSFFKIIESVSGFSEGIYTDHEEDLHRRVKSYTTRYASTLDGIYDIFVFQQFREHWEYYRSLDSHERLDMLGFFQAVSGVDVFERLQYFRSGLTSTIKFDSSLDTKMINDQSIEKANINREMVVQAAADLSREIQTAKRRKNSRPRKINTESENADFRKFENS